jgi:hypothetical protein
MRLVRSVIAAGILLAFPASTMAADLSSFPKPSGTYCEANHPDKCYTIQPTDRMTYSNFQENPAGSGFFHTGSRTYSVIASPECWYMYSSLAVWRQYGSPSSSRICVRTGTQLVTYMYQQYMFPDIPEQDKQNFHPEKILGISNWYSNYNHISSIISVQVFPQHRSNYCRYFTSRDGDGIAYSSGVALDRTPPSIMESCSFREKMSEYQQRIAREQQEQQNNNDNNDNGVDVTIPEDTDNCGRVNNGNDLVSVRSSNNPCSTAKTVLRSYSRTLRSPRGWTCNASMNDSRFKARCSKKQTSRSGSKRKAAVYGAWTRR